MKKTSQATALHQLARGKGKKTKNPRHALEKFSFGGTEGEAVPRFCHIYATCGREGGTIRSHDRLVAPIMHAESNGAGIHQGAYPSTCTRIEGASPMRKGAAGYRPQPR